MCELTNTENAFETRIPGLKNIKHIKYLISSLTTENNLEKLLSEHLRLGTTYWGLGALHLLTHRENQDHTYFLSHLQEAIDASFSPQHSVENLFGNLKTFIKQCRVGSTGFSYSIRHDAHITSTLYALLSLLLLNDFEIALQSSHELSKWIRSLQQPDGSFQGDSWGESDSRFTYCSIASLALLGTLDYIDKSSAIQWIQSCQNEDHAFGPLPGAESHAAYTYCCVAGDRGSWLDGYSALLNLVERSYYRLALSIFGDIEDYVDADALGFWLVERQLPMPCGGFNGRPEKAPDVCYSWWILASLRILKRDSWIDRDALVSFILASQDNVDGGIADRPGDIPDVFHTFFGVAALVLLNVMPHVVINPIYALSPITLQRSKVAPSALQLTEAL